MADFIVTDPTGKEHIVTAPEGATQEQALEFAKSAFNSTLGGAATGVQKLPRQTSPLGGGLEAIAGATVLGGVAGAVAPEILTGLAGVARSIPQGARFAPFFESAAIATKGTGRSASATIGAMSGTASETAGQAAEAAGAGPVTAEATRFVAGGLGPEVPSYAFDVARRRFFSPIYSWRHAAFREIAARMGRKLDDLTQEQVQIIDDELEKAVVSLRGSTKTDAPLEKLYGDFAIGTQAKLLTASSDAQKIIADSERAASKELADAVKGPVSYMRNASDRIKMRGETALSAAQLQRLNVGNDLELSDIGASLRGKIVERNAGALESKSSEYKANEIARNAVVKEKEAGRNYVTSVPEYQRLVAELRSEIVPGKRSQDVAKNFEHILNQIQNPEKDVFGQNKPISFQALDDVRRKLGDAFSGQSAEGYDAIGEVAAKKYYNIISDIQKKYAGEPQEKLLRQYAEAKEGLQMFGSKTGKRMTAVDRYDDSQFQTDARMLPKQFFSSKQSIQDLVELTGDRKLVVDAAKDFATNELRDKSAQEIKNWMTSRRELLASIPEVRKSVVDYLNILERGETVSRSADRAIKLLQSRETDTIRESEARGTALRRGSERAATSIQSAAEGEARTVMGTQFPADRIRALIESGNREQWNLSAPLILASSGGKQAMVDSVAQVMADRASTSIKGLSEFFARKVRPGLEATNLMNPPEINRLAMQLSQIENMTVPEVRRLGLARRLILQSFGGYAAGLVPRGKQAYESSLENLVPRSTPGLANLLQPTP